jgi:hypothetical protein
MAFAVVGPTATAATIGMKFFIGRLTGTWLGDVAGKGTVTLLANFQGNPSTTNFGAYFAYIPPTSGYIFQLDVSTLTSNFAVYGAAASNVGTTLASITYSVEMTSFNMVFNGIATAGVPIFCVAY